ncbi:putative Sm domain-containing protein [Seiridium cardinale]|uniref:Sm domain-containing protein n=1 Tax=Seiridium cardinale TaxID=138064 RepID=A0ABR2XPS8_9PEZI
MVGPRKLSIEEWKDGDADYAFFKTLIDNEVTVELKNDIQIRGTLKSVDQYLNIKLDDIRVVDEIKYPHLKQRARLKRQNESREDFGRSGLEDKKAKRVFRSPDIMGSAIRPVRRKMRQAMLDDWDGCAGEA